MVIATMALFVAALALNVLVFQGFEFAPGINWVYLPAGVRLFSTLMFAEEGAIGLLLVSWLVSFGYFFPDNQLRAFMGGIVAAAAPYLVYLAARQRWGLETSLTNLTPSRLLILAVCYSIASPLLHHIWFALQGQDHLVSGFVAMFVGDLNGTLLVIYGSKLLLSLLPGRPLARKTDP